MPTTRYETYIPEGMVPEIEAYCDKNDLSGSEFFREAAKEKLPDGGVEVEG